MEPSENGHAPKRDRKWKRRETKRLSQQDIQTAADLLRAGGLVGIPTETVYGLGANGLDPAAVGRIFQAKGRPQDNPLILHIPGADWLERYCRDIPAAAYELARRFWPGPLTMIMPKSDRIPLVTSGGLDTVGIRFPSDECAHRIIEKCGFPLAAPSANLSGSPSPTNAKRVFEDMNGRIAAIVDGGESEVGVESTVIAFENEGIRILRPGKIAYEDLKAVTDNVFIDHGVLERVAEGEKVRSPGMKYKHYAPKAEVVLLDGTAEEFRGYVKENSADGYFCLVFSDKEAVDGVPYLTYGESADEQAHWLFERLRQFDGMGAKKVFAHCPSQDGVGLAVYNRILRSAGFNVIELGKNI